MCVVTEQIAYGPPAGRVTVALLPEVAVELAHLQERTGRSKTDLANRAVTLYEWADAQIRAGLDILVRDPATGKTQLIRLL
jgi:predicted transcriptional regulator